MQSKQLLRTVLPVMFGYFIMAFVDVLGIATNYVKADFQFSDTVSSLLSVACFVWFLLLSVPTGILLNRFGRKNMVIVSFAVTFVALLLPVISYSFPMVLSAFALIGIGNTILQVSMNPLVKDVVSGDRLTGTLTLGQFVKAVSSFLAPIIASAFAGTVFGWKWIFPIFAVVSLIAAVWLFLAPIRQETVAPAADLSFGAAFSLLKDKYIRLFFIGILVLVGADVGMGISLPKVLNERFGWVESKATLGNSLYFLARTVSAFCGGILLMKLREDKFYVVSIFVALAGLAGIVFSHSYVLMVISVVLFGFGYANLFSILFSLSLKHMPLKSNEVSALLVTGIAGGGLVAPVLGIVTDILHTQTAAFAALLLIWVYMFLIIKPVSRISGGGR